MNTGGKGTGFTVLAYQIGFLAFLLTWYFTRGLSPRYDILFGALLIIPFWYLSRQTVLRDLIPFFMILITYESLRGFGNGVRFIDIHVEDIITYEKTLFGGIIPAYYLQSTLMQGSLGSLFNYLTLVFYASHYFVPLIIAILLWYRSRSYYWPFVIGFILVAYIGFVIYIFFPAAPPWWATKYGYLVDQPVNLPASFVTMSSLTSHIGPNKVAAMPSLHMSFPTYSVLFCVHVWGRKYIWMFILPLCVGFSTIYLGHHYIIDLMAGMLLAFSVFSGIYAVYGNWIQVQYRAEQRGWRHLAKNNL